MHNSCFIKTITDDGSQRITNAFSVSFYYKINLREIVNDRYLISISCFRAAIVRKSGSRWNGRATV